MKRIVLKISIIAFILNLFIMSQVFAEDSFTVQFKDNLFVNSGEEIEVPITIRNFNFNDSVQRGIIGFNCTLDYNPEVFDLVSTTDGLNTIYISIPENMKDVVSRLFSPESGGLVMRLKPEEIEQGSNYINTYLEVATITLRAKEGLYSGYYPISIINVEGGNTEVSIDAQGGTSNIYVKGIDRDDGSETIPMNSDDFGIGENVDVDKEDLIADIRLNDDKTKMIITPNNTEGREVVKVTVNGAELTMENGSFTADVVEGETYTIMFYNADGSFIGMKSYTVGYSENNGSSDSKNGNKYNSDAFKASFDDEDEDEEEAKSVKDVVKSIVTGDSIVLWIAFAGIVAMATVILLAARKYYNK